MITPIFMRNIFTFHYPCVSSVFLYLFYCSIVESLKMPNHPSTATDDDDDKQYIHVESAARATTDMREELRINPSGCYVAGTFRVRDVLARFLRSSADSWVRLCWLNTMTTLLLLAGTRKPRSLKMDYTV